MCEICNIAEEHALVFEARTVADRLLGDYLRVKVTKAMDVGTPKGFDRAVATLAALLQARASGTDHEAVKAAVEVLDIDWHQTTAEQRRSLIGQALEAAGRKTKEVPAKIQTVFNDAATEVVRATRDSVMRDQKLIIGADFNAIDERIIRHLRTSQANYLSDEYGRRHLEFGEKARQIVANGLAEGLGRNDIARELEAAAQNVLAGKSSFYWDIVAGAFVGRGRSFGQLSAYAEASIERYVIHAVLDEATTEVCRFLDGKEFSVGAGLESFAQVEAKPDAIKTINPWVRDGSDPDGRRIMYVNGRGGKKHRLAVVDQPGIGLRDQKGSYSSALSPSKLQQIGISAPPLHAACRSTVLPDVSARIVTPRISEAVPEPTLRNDGPAELLGASKTFGSTSGQALPLDSDFIENCDVQFRVERIEGNDITKVRFKVTDQRAAVVRDALLKGEKPNTRDTYRHRRGERDPKTGRIVKAEENSYVSFNAVSASFGGTRVRMVTDKGSLTNFVEMDIPTTNASDMFKAYGEAAKRLSIADATSFPSEASIEALRQARLITQYDRVGWEKLRTLKELSPESVGPIFRESVKRFPELEKVVADSKVVQTARGHVALHSKDQAERLRQDGVHGLFHDMSSTDALVPILTDPDGSGLLSSTQRYSRGIFINGMSTQTDFGTGGADGVFTRIVAKGMRDHSPPSNGARLLIDTDQLGRSDWYFFNFDNYGRAGPVQYNQRKLVPEMKSTLRDLSTSNEMVFQHGIPLEALRGMVIPNASERAQALQRLRKAGVVTVNGKPIEQFVMSKEVY
jgi:hypothetical protein